MTVGLAPDLVAEVEEGEVYTLRLAGSLDGSGAELCRRSLLGSDRRVVVLDLGGVRAMDRPGLETLASARVEIVRSGRRLVIVGARGPVRRCFERAGMAPLLGH